MVEKGAKFDPSRPKSCRYYRAKLQMFKSTYVQQSFLVSLIH